MCFFLLVGESQLKKPRTRGDKYESQRAARQSEGGKERGREVQWARAGELADFRADVLGLIFLGTLLHNEWVATH